MTIQRANVGDTVKITARRGGQFESEHAGKEGRVTEVQGSGDCDRIYLSFDNGDTDWGYNRDLTIIRRKDAPVVTERRNRPAPSLVNTPEGSGNVFRIEVLYKDNSRFNLGGISAFRLNSANTKGEDCIQYTKAVNDDVEGIYYVKRKDIAALVLRYDNGKTEIFEYSKRVLDTVSVKMQPPTKKTILTDEQRTERTARRKERDANRLESVEAKKALKKAEKRAKSTETVDE